jgi:hypothetical protein
MGQSILNRGSARVRSDAPMRQADMPPRDRNLTMCLGFQVDGPNGRFGTVIGMAYGSRTRRPDAIEVRVGLFHRTVIVVPPEEVIAADPSTRRLTLRRDPLTLQSASDLDALGSRGDLAARRIATASNSKGGDDVNVLARNGHS